MDLLTTLTETLLNKTKDDQPIRLEFLLRNSFNLWTLTVHLLQRPLLSPLAVAAHNRLGRLIMQTALTPSIADVGKRKWKARNFAAWSIRVLSPPRVYLEERPPGSCCPLTSFADERLVRAENANWHAICQLSSLQEQSIAITEVLRTDVRTRSTSGAIAVSAAIPIFDRILVENSTFAHLDKLEKEEEAEGKRWALCGHYGGFLATVWNQVRPTEAMYDSIESYSQLCEALQFSAIYKVSFIFIGRVN